MSSRRDYYRDPAAPEANSLVGGTIATSDESTDVRFVDPAEFDRIPIHDTVRLRLRHHAEHRDHPYLG